MDKTDLSCQALVIDPFERTMTALILTDSQTEIPRLIGCERLGQWGKLYFDADRACDELFAGNCERTPGPYLRIDHVQLHIHSKAVVFPLHWRDFRLEEFAVWKPQKGLYRRIWSRR